MNVLLFVAKLLAANSPASHADTIVQTENNTNNLVNDKLVDEIVKKIIRSKLSETLAQKPSTSATTDISSAYAVYSNKKVAPFVNAKLPAQVDKSLRYYGHDLTESEARRNQVVNELQKIKEKLDTFVKNRAEQDLSSQPNQVILSDVPHDMMLLMGKMNNKSQQQRRKDETYSNKDKSHNPLEQKALELVSKSSNNASIEKTQERNGKIESQNLFTSSKMPTSYIRTVNAYGAASNDQNTDEQNVNSANTITQTINGITTTTNLNGGGEAIQISYTNENGVPNLVVNRNGQEANAREAEKIMKQVEDSLRGAFSNPLFTNMMPNFRM